MSTTLHNHHLNKIANGANGYKRLVRLVVRTFYSGQCPPPELEEEGAPVVSRRAAKHTFPGLGVLVVDLLASVDGYVDEEDVCRALRLSQKHVRKALRYLEAEGLLAFQDVKFRKPRAPKANGASAAAAAAPGAKVMPPSLGGSTAGGEEEEVPMRKETKVFWCVDYPRLKDSLRLRLHRVRDYLKEQVQDANPLQSYICPACGARYSSLDAVRLLDFATGAFRCEDCRGELVEHVEGGAGSRKDAAARAKDLQSRLEAQLKPIIDQLERLKDVDPPDWGSLQDYFAEQQAAAKAREKRAAAAAKRSAAAAAQGAGEAQQEWLDTAEVQVNFGGPSAAAAAAAAEPGKELPAWFKTASGLASNTTSAATVEPSTAAGGIAGLAGPDGGGAGGAAAAALLAADEDAEREKRIKEAYLQQYLAEVARAREAAAAGAGGDDKKDVKRIKTEAGWAAAEFKVEPKAEPKAEPAAAVEGGGWQQVAGQQAQQAQQQQQQQQQGEAEAVLVGEDFGDWEDVAAEPHPAQQAQQAQQQQQQQGQGGGEVWEDVGAPKQEDGGGGGAAGLSAGLDDDFEWEDL